MYNWPAPHLWEESLDFMEGAEHGCLESCGKWVAPERAGPYVSQEPRSTGLLSRVHFCQDLPVSPVSCFIFTLLDSEKETAIKLT